MWTKPNTAEGAGGVCNDIDCSSYKKDTDCKDVTVNKFCSWDTTAKTCIKTVIPPVVCSSKTTQADCPSTELDECVWQVADKKCVDKQACNLYKGTTSCEENKACKVIEAGNRCIITPTETNWDKEIVVKRAWYDKTLFTLAGGKLRVTSGMAVGAVIAIIVVALLVSAVMSYVAYKKREVIATEMRKVSTKIRASLKGKQPDAPADPNHPDNKD